MTKERWKFPGYRCEKPIPYDRIVDKSVDHQVRVPWTNCSHRLDHRGPQLSGIEEILVWFSYFLIFSQNQNILVFFSTYWVHVLPMFIMKSAASATIKPIPAKKLLQPQNPGNIFHLFATLPSAISYWSIIDLICWPTWSDFLVIQFVG